MAATPDHFEIILAGLAAGRTAIAAPPPGAPQAATLAAMAELGARVQTREDGAVVTGTGNGCLLQPARALALASAPAALMVAGLLAPYDMPATVTSTEPLAEADRAAFVAAVSAMGTQIASAGAGSIGLAGQASTFPARHDGSAWSDAVLAAVALAALDTPGTTEIAAPRRTIGPLAERLARFAASVDLAGAGENVVLAVHGQQTLLAPDRERAA